MLLQTSEFIMKIPENVEVSELPTSTTWIDENGICCSISKKHPPQTLEETKKGVEEFKKITKGKKVCLLIDTTNSTPSSKEVRDYAAEIFPDLVKAIAMVSKSALGRMIANLFFGLKPPPYPVKMFSEETEAKEWLKQYL